MLVRIKTIFTIVISNYMLLEIFIITTRSRNCSNTQEEAQTVFFQLKYFGSVGFNILTTIMILRIVLSYFPLTPTNLQSLRVIAISVPLRFGIPELRNRVRDRVTQNDATLRVTNPKFYIEILLPSYLLDFMKY